MIDVQWYKDKGKYLQQLRKKRFPQDTQRDFAARIGVGLTTVQNLEAGKDGVAWGTLAKALEILGQQAKLEALFAPEEFEPTIKAGEDW